MILSVIVNVDIALTELKNKDFYEKTFSTIYELTPEEIIPFAETLQRRNVTVFNRMMADLQTVLGGKFFT